MSEFTKSVMSSMERGATGGEIRSPHSMSESKKDKKAKTKALKGKK